MHKSIIHKGLAVLTAAVTAIAMTSCLGNNDEPEYNEWREKNEATITAAENETKDGVKVWEKITPDWAPSTFTLIKWETDRALTAGKLTPLDNSTIRMKYHVDTIEGERIDDSYSNKEYGDSIYETTPSRMITGVRAALAYMHPGDSVTLLVPYTAGYGVNSHGTIKPYSTLRFGLKLVAITEYMKD